MTATVTPIPDSQQNMKGASLALFFGFIQVCNDAVMKALVADLGFYQILMVRGLLVMPLIILILKWRDELSVSLSARDRRILTVRVFCEVALSYFMLNALMTLPLAYVTIVIQAIPLGLTMAAAVFYKEAVGWRRWLAIIAGFVGVMLIVRPGSASFQPEMFYVIISVVIFIFRDMITRQLSSNVPTFYTVYQQVIGVTLFNLVMCYFDEWVPLAPVHYGMMLIAGVLFMFMTLSAILMMRFGDISFVAQFRYSGIIWAIIIGTVLFQETPDAPAMIGAVMIVVAGLYALYRERQIKARKLVS